MRLSVKFSVTSLLVLVILAVVYGVASQLQVPEWVLQFAFYAFMTAMFGFVFGVLLLLVRDYLYESKLKRDRRLESLDVLKGEYSQCKWSIEKIIENTEKNAIADSVPQLVTSIDMGELRFSEKLQEVIRKYSDQVNDYNIFRKVSEAHIKNSMEKKIMRMFPKSLGKYNELPEMFCSDLLMARYFSGERVTESWFKETQPIMLKNIMKSIDESERHELDVLFNEINNEFKNEGILLRFRKQKEMVIQEGKKIVENLSREIASRKAQAASSGHF